MGAIVFASAGGRKYHFDKQCKAFESAQMLSDLDCGCDTYCTHQLPRMHGLVRMSVTKAAIDGKLPCLGCVPTHLREMPDAEDFGHEPVALDSVIHENWTKFSACSGCKARTTPLVCVRCMEFDANGMWRIPAHPVHWPCTSALVLGIAPRLNQ